MESWQKELKEGYGYWEAKLWGRGNLAYIFIAPTGLPLAIRKVKIKEIIATHIMPSFPNVKYAYDDSIQNYAEETYPFYQGDCGETITEFCRAINSVKYMEDDTEGSGGSGGGDGTDYSSIIIIILIVIAAWIFLK